MNWKNTVLASAVASLFIAGAAQQVVSGEEAGAEAKVKCEGVNACKGQSECATATNGCKGHNACKGKGHLNVTQKECDDLKAKMAEESKG
jgi:uncharacterized membrane protein